jgi:protein-export membrane protein SecD
VKIHNTSILVLVVLVAVLAGLFVYPGNLISKRLPWRLGLDLVGGSHLVYEVNMSGVNVSDRDSVVAGLRDVIEQRVNLFGVSEPQVVSSQAGDSYRLIVELAGISDVSEAIKEIGSTPLLDFREVVVSEGSEEYQFIPTNLTGRYVKSAQLNFDPTTGAPAVDIEFNEEGAKIFEELTAKNVNKPLAIFLDNNLIEMPNVSEKISGGKAQISGGFTADTAKKLVERFNAGALPAPINLIGQQVVGASLGEESMDKAVQAGFWGFIAVILFMLLYYRMFGLFASLALLIYVVLTLAVFKVSPGFTMSLAGIAGFLLSIGMAVDANILIFERTKEELKRGLSKIAAIEEGFKRSWPSIRDSNISTIITSVILYYFTTSFIKGFALTLLIGVLVSMFSAIVVTRSLMRAFIRK